jgi:long-chain acyl-CoA synthetase
LNIAAHMRRAGNANAARAAIARGSSVVHSYGALADRVARLAQSLRHRLNLEPGERVALAMKNCPEYLEVLYACWHAGLVAVPINAKLHPAEIDYILTDSGASACFVSAQLGSGLGAAVRRLIEVGSAEYDGLLTAKPLQLLSCDAADTAWLFYTSGTTGRPKGATLSHGNLLAMSLCYCADVDQRSPWSAILHAAPMSHGSGL